MAGLNSQPADALLDRIANIERQLREVSTVRKSPAEGVTVVNPFPVAFVTGGDYPDWIGTDYQASANWFPPGWSGGNLVVPISGLYLCIGLVGQLSVGTPTHLGLRILNSSESGFGDKRPASYMMSHRIVTLAEFDAGDETNLLIDTQANATYLGAELKILRLADPFFQTPDLFPF